MSKNQGEVGETEIKVRFGNEPLNPSPGKTPASTLTQRETNTAHHRGLSLHKPKEKNSSPASTAEAEEINHHKVEQILSELDELVGLKLVKKLVTEICAYVEIQKKRAREHLLVQPVVMHMIFRGNPGTGKTTVARMLGKLLKEIGVLQKGHMIEVERADLVGEYIGHTAQKTRDHIRKSIGGILFIDEAYSLARGGEKDFGKESIDCLTKAMEDYKDNLVLILAGYKDEMEWFIRTNPGLRSRFPIHLDFPDYTVGELMEIALGMLQQREYRLSLDAQVELERVIKRQVSQGPQHSGNARLVRNLIEKSIRKQAVRLVNCSHITREELMLISKEDLPVDAELPQAGGLTNPLNWPNIAEIN